jgi:uncharacterized protein
MMLSGAIVNPQEDRLRAGWRMLLHLLLLVLLTGLFGLIAGLAAVSSGSAEGDAGLLLTSAAQLLAVTVSVRLARRFFDRRSMGSLGLYRQGAVRDLLFGVLLAAGMMAFIYAAELLLGWIRFEGYGWSGGRGAETYAGVLVWLAIFLMVGWYEELLARGYWLVNLSEGLNRWLAALLTAVAFSALHLANPNASRAAAVGLFFGGLFFAYAALRSRALWLPVGLHIGWNFFEGVVFGFPVSGLTTTRLLQHTATGPALWTGGPFGPEAGLILLPALALGALVVWAWTRARRNNAAGSSRTVNAGAAPNPEDRATA